MKKLILPGVLGAFLSIVSADTVVRPATVGESLTKTFPYSMAGQVILKNGTQHYLASGTVVGQRSVLTAAHPLWNPDSGWSTEVRFYRARSGASIGSRELASRLFVFASYRGTAARYGADSLPAFASDLGGLRFKAMPAAGLYAGWKQAPGTLTGGVPSLCLGYGASVHSGDELLSVTPNSRFIPTLGAFMENYSLTFEQGMSGGPVFAAVAPDDWRVVAVIVAGSDNPPAGAIRAIDAQGAAFIAAYLLE